MAPLPDSLPAALATRLTARELETLTDRLRGVELQLEAVYHKAGHHMTGDEIHTLQEIDVVVQSTAALAQYIGQLAEGLPKDLSIPVGPALDRIPLADLAGRLRGGETLPGLPERTTLF
mgnify:CR=1 FL=1